MVGMHTLSHDGFVAADEATLKVLDTLCLVIGILLVSPICVAILYLYLKSLKKKVSNKII